ncbi:MULTISPECIES: glycine-rich domain-containing protein [Pseudomonas]|uniref:glycine-rich domain-containing protein n=1 Tax=Pseudomonas TaxID=286 RepID=UPI000CD44167|nr:hypothetical protein [Pseudomonas putida]MCE0975440.1 hypothetical protein [Pseudomonas putida]MCE1004822.1 hypothetical protein [Pseudomonas sp. NMI1173_11]POF91301.1 hypothetical protein BGP83_00900 [Pseudomonas putida]
MTQQIDNTVFEQALALTATWDFKLAIEKVLEIKNGEWTRERAEKAVQNYTRYMAVTKALGGLQMVPNGDIDEIWHMHILDTRAYMADCNALFGEYLHHYPYFGMLGEENRKQWLQVQDESTNLWMQLFGEPLYGADSAAQKCPQVCPCNIDDLTITSSGLTDVLRSA